MSTRKLKEMFLTLPELNLPEPSDLVAYSRVVELTSIEPDGMTELVEMEWVRPIKTNSEEFLFRLRDVYRVQKLTRLCNDLDVSMIGGSIIVDLLERIESLETELEELRRLA